MGVYIKGMDMLGWIAWKEDLLKERERRNESTDSM